MSDISNKYGTQAMNVSEARREMDEVIEALEVRLQKPVRAAAQSNLIDKALKAIERIRKAFQHRIDTRAQQMIGLGTFARNEREGVERKLRDCTEVAIIKVKDFQDRTGGST